MSWILTFILGWIGGAIGMHMFVMWYGQHIAAKNVIRTTEAGVFDGNGNPIPEDDPRYKEAIEHAKAIAKIFEDDNQDENAENH